MDNRNIFKKLTSQCPVDYRINEIIRFKYPYIITKLKAQVNKSPDSSILQIYSVILRAIDLGMRTEKELFKFLGLKKGDFIIREIFYLKECAYIDETSQGWSTTNAGKTFIRDNSILRTLEDEEFKFIVDAKTGDFVSAELSLQTKKDTEKGIEAVHKDLRNNSMILENRFDELSELYMQDNTDGSLLIGYDLDNILFCKPENSDYYFIEYIPIESKEDEIESYIEVRCVDKDLTKDKRVTEILTKEYPEILYEFTDSERAVLSEIEDYDDEKEFEDVVLDKSESDSEILSIWETQSVFKESLRSAKKRILVESPWIKKASLKYKKLFEDALKRGVEIYVLYGIDAYSDNDSVSERMFRTLENNNENFHLIFLPDHFASVEMLDLTGTHRKLLIKDSEFFVQGSFNFLSFNKQEGQRVANEESVKINREVDKKWNAVMLEYQIYGFEI